MKSYLRKLDIAMVVLQIYLGFDFKNHKSPYGLAAIYTHPSQLVLRFKSYSWTPRGICGYKTRGTAIAMGRACQKALTVNIEYEPLFRFIFQANIRKLCHKQLLIQKNSTRLINFQIALIKITVSKYFSYGSTSPLV